MKKLRAQLGFTMIELLIVITILGILAVAVLAAINPIEQINRGRDTGSQSDAEQLLSAIDRYNAFQGFYPWQVDADDLDISVSVEVSDDDVPVPLHDNDDDDVLEHIDVVGFTGTDSGDNTVYCSILDRLSTGVDDFTGDGTDAPTNCTGSQELKDSFVTRMLGESARTLYIYNSGQAGGSTYVCFIPRSGAFKETADTRCDGEAGAGLPEDIDAAAAAYICGGSDARTEDDPVAMVCLP